MPSVAAAQPQVPGLQLGSDVRVSGYTRAFFETSNRGRFGQLIPETRFRAEIAPTVFVKGVPLAFNAMYSTEDNEIGRSVGGFAISLNLGTAELEQIVRDRIDGAVAGLSSEALEASGAGSAVAGAQDAVATAQDARQTAEQRIDQLLDLREDLDGPRPSLSQLQELGLLTAQERLAMRFPALGIGTTYPTHSPYSLNGVAVNGLNVEFAPGSILLGVAVGRVRDPVPFNNRFVIGVDSVAYDRQMYAARIGAGRPDGKHFFLSGTYFSDETVADSLLLFQPRRPEQNVIAGVSTQWSTAARTVNVYGEFAASVYTGDRQGAILEDEIPGPEFLKNAIDINSTSSADFAGKGGIDLRIREQALKIDADYEQVGPGYVTLGNPLLRNDFRRVSGGFEKHFSRRQVAVSASGRFDSNNISGYQLFTSSARTIRTRVSLRFRGKPHATIQFSPTLQKTETDGDAGTGDNIISEFRNRFVIVSAGHRYKIGERASGVTNINLSDQQTSTDAEGFDLATTVVSITQSVTVSRFTVTGLASLFRQRDVDLPLNSNVFDIGVSVEAVRGVFTTVGFNTFSEVDRSSERGVYASVNADAGPLGTLFARVETSKFDDKVFDSRSFSQTRLTATLMRRW